MSDAANTAATDLLPQPMTPEQATERQRAFVNDPTLRTQLLRGDPKATAEFRQVHETLAANRPAQSEPDRRLSDFIGNSDLPPAVIEQIKSNAPVSPAEYNEASRAKERAMSDEAFVRRYLSGDREARREMQLLHIILASPIRS